MALIEYVDKKLDGLLQRYIGGVKDPKNSITDDFVKDSLYGNIETYSKIINGMKKFSHEYEGKFNPKVNEDLEDVLEYFISEALSDNEDPSRLYRKILDTYDQEIFNNKEKEDRAYLIVLSKIYIDNLSILRNIDPKTKQRYYPTRQEKEDAAKTIDIVKKLLEEALYEYWSSKGKKISKGKIKRKLTKFASSSYGKWEGVKGKIENDIGMSTPNDDLKEAVEELVVELENKYISFIKGLIVSAYNERPVPEHIIRVLKYANPKEFFKDVFSEMYNEIGSYINQLQPQIAQYLQQNQPAGQQPNAQLPQQNLLVGQQQGQQVNQPQQTTQPPANQQPALQQQQAPQVQNQPNTPQPKVIKSSP